MVAGMQGSARGRHLRIIVTENGWGAAMESFSGSKWNGDGNERHKK